jgi:hypothetical protein
MARRVFYSFHYQADAWRTNQVRHIGTVDGTEPATHNAWEAIKKGGDKAIQKWIDDNLHGKSCLVVLVGTNTAGRQWIKYEIAKAWNDGKGVMGIYIHNLKNHEQRQSTKGRNPFEDITIGTKKLSSIVKCYDPPQTLSHNVYAHIAANLADWIEKAIEIRVEN